MRHLVALVLMLLTFGFAASAQENAQADEPLDLGTFNCEEHLAIKEEGNEDYVVLTVWAHGYDSALRGVDETAAPITWEMVHAFADRLENSCLKTPQKLFIRAVQELHNTPSGEELNR